MSELRKQFKIEHPETVGETDSSLDDSNCIDWLEAKLKQGQELPINNVSKPVICPCCDGIGVCEDIDNEKGACITCGGSGKL